MVMSLAMLLFPLLVALVVFVAGCSFAISMLPPGPRSALAWAVRAFGKLVYGALFGTGNKGWW